VSELKRITPEEVVAAYRESGMKPKRGHFNVDGCGCGIGAKGCQRFGSLDTPSDQIADWAEATYGGEYCDGFYEGFDGNEMSQWDINERYVLGHADGVFARLACIEAFGEF
jgi:hypothetical protein